MNLKEIFGALVYYIDLAEIWGIWRDRALVNTVVNFRINKRGELLSYASHAALPT